MKKRLLLVLLALIASPLFGMRRVQSVSKGSTVSSLSIRTLATKRDQRFDIPFYFTPDRETERALKVFKETAIALARVEDAQCKQGFSDDIIGTVVMSPTMAYAAKAFYLGVETVPLNYVVALPFACIALAWPGCIVKHLVENSRRKKIEREVMHVTLPPLRERFSALPPGTWASAQKIVRLVASGQSSQEKEASEKRWQEIEAALQSAAEDKQ